MSIEQLVAVAASLGGVGFLISVLVNIGKTVGLIKDGQAQNWVTGGNLLVMVLVYAGGLIKPDLDMPGIDSTVGQVAQILAMSFSLIWPMIASKITHNALKGTAIIGKSYTAERLQAANQR